ncbi:MAG: hypothetical protein JRJ84_16555, partial [Deltaproteobacteria bacterium]|nr:hypothetical protein [Deltaproteobacteria bacterium]
MPGKEGSGGSGRTGCRLGCVGAFALGALGVAALAAATLYVQTPHGFQQVVLPLARRVSGYDLAAESGRFALDGSLEVLGARFADPEAGLSAQVDSLQLRTSLSSWLGDDPPLLHAVVLRGATLQIDRSVGEEDVSEEPLELEIPVRIGRAALEDCAVRLVDGERTQLILGGIRGRVADLAPGQEGTIALRSNAVAAPDDAKVATDGALDLGLVATQDPENGDLLWKGGGSALVRAREASAGLSGETRFDLETSGTVRERTTAEGTLGLVARRGEHDLGKMSATGSGDVDGQGPLEAKVDLEGLTPAFLNPFLAVRSGVQLRRGQVDGKLDLTTVGRDLRFESSLDGRDLVLASAEGGAPTSPAVMHGTGSGALARDGTTLRLEKAELLVDQAGRRLVTVGLERPLTLRVRQDATSAPATDKAARFSVRLDRVPVADLRPWLALAGTDVLDRVETGTVDALASVDVAGEGASVAVRGNWTGTDLRFGASGRPITLAQPIDIKVRDLVAIEIVPTVVQVSTGSETIGSASVGGTLHRKSGAAELSFEASAESLVVLLRRFDLFPEWAEGSVRGGTLAARGKVTQTSWEEGASLTVNLETKGLRLRTDRGLAGLRSATTELIANLPADWGEMTVEKGTVALTDGSGAPAGGIEVSGSYPWKAGRAGRLELKAEDVETRVWLEVLGMLSPGAVNVLPMDAELVLAREEGAAAWTLEGTEKLGPLQVKDARSGSATLEIEFTTSLKDGSAEGLVLDLTSSVKGQTDGRVHLEGAVRFADTLSATLAGTATGFDASPYLDAYLGVEETTDDAPFDLLPYVSWEAPADLDVQVDLERVVVHGFEIGSGTLVLKGKAGNLTVALDAPGFGGGTATGFLTRTATGRTPGLEWVFEAQGTDVGGLLKASQQGMASYVVGRGDITSRGKGRGSGRALATNLKGKLTFNVADGRFGETELLAFIARETRISSFDQMRFDAFDGEVNIRKGVVHLRQGTVLDPESKLAATGRLLEDGTQDWRINPRVVEQLFAGIASGLGASTRMGDDGYISL